MEVGSLSHSRSLVEPALSFRFVVGFYHWINDLALAVMLGFPIYVVCMLFPSDLINDRPIYVVLVLSWTLLLVYM